MKKIPLIFQRLCLLIMCLPFLAVADEVRKEEAAAREVTQQLMQELGSAMMREMQQGGPASAIQVCRDLAPAITGRLSRERGWQIRRVGTRVRNPLLGMPDAWEQRVLQQFATRAKQGEALQGMVIAEEVAEPAGRYFRYAQAIGVQPSCLACHGDPATFDESVREQLKQHYPHDRATGYQPGDLRGAFSIKIPL